MMERRNNLQQINPVDGKVIDSASLEYIQTYIWASVNMQTSQGARPSVAYW